MHIRLIHFLLIKTKKIMKMKKLNLINQQYVKFFYIYLIICVLFLAMGFLFLGEEKMEVMLTTSLLDLLR